MLSIFVIFIEPVPFKSRLFLLTLSNKKTYKYCFRDMKKIINPWEGLDGYMCFGCAPNNPLGLHMEFFEDGDDIVRSGSSRYLPRIAAYVARRYTDYADG